VPGQVVRGGIVACTLALAAAFPLRGQAGLEQRLQAKLDSLHAAASFPGAVLGVALADGRAFTLAVGFADTALKSPMPRAARMLAGSVGKTFFAALAMQLVHEGKLRLDEPIATYLSGEPWFDRLPNGRQATVRMLMNHTSGLVRYEFVEAVTARVTAEPDHVWTPAERLSYIMDGAPSFAAGQDWQYSDTNYIVLGVILQRLLGTDDLYAEVQRRILEPLGLRDVIPSDRRELPGVVQGYAGPNNPFGGRDAMIEHGRFIMNPQMEWTGGGYATTAGDLARWAKLLYQGKAFVPELLREVLAGVPAPGLGREVKYGLGVMISPSPLGAPSLGHSGFFPGYLTEMRYFPSHGFALALQFNTSVGRAIGRNPGAVLVELARIVAEAR
jgi:D-alanyl-D-alanine carboxypeptidase